MGILCKAVITDRVKDFEVCERSAGDKKVDDVLLELKTTWLCRVGDYNSLSWGQQRVSGLVRFETVVKAVKDVSGSVLNVKIIWNRANYCGALLAMPAANQLLKGRGHATVYAAAPSGTYRNLLFQSFLTNANIGRQMMLAEMISPYLIDYHEHN